MAYGNNKQNKAQESPLIPKPGRALPESPARFAAPPLLPGKEIDLKREAFNRKQFNDTINTQFTELGIGNQPDPANFDPSLATVGDFFTIYQSLFFQIPKEGDVNSHLFLIKESTEYLNYIAQQEEIEALLAEIAELRTQNLELVADLQTVTDSLTEAIANIETQ